MDTTSTDTRPFHDIATAPRDGRWIELQYNNSAHLEAQWRTYAWFDKDGDAFQSRVSTGWREILPEVEAGETKPLGLLGEMLSSGIIGTPQSSAAPTQGRTICRACGEYTKDCTCFDNIPDYEPSTPAPGASGTPIDPNSNQWKSMTQVERDLHNTKLELSAALELIQDLNQRWKEATDACSAALARAEQAESEILAMSNWWKCPEHGPFCNGASCCCADLHRAGKIDDATENHLAETELSETARQLAEAKEERNEAENESALGAIEIATLRAAIAEAKALTAIDGPVFTQGRHEGWSDIRLKLQLILDPDDSEKLNIDGLLALVATLRATLTSAERDEALRKRDNPRIYTRCPSCGNDCLTINDGHLLCTWIECKDPCAIEKGHELRATVATLTAERDELKRILASEDQVSQTPEAADAKRKILTTQ